MTEAVPQSFTGPDEPGPGPSGGKPWGPWATAGFGLLVLAAFYVIQTLVGVVFSAPILSERPEISSEELASLLTGNGLFLAVATIATGVLCTLLVLWLARKRRSIAVRDYLALAMPPTRTVLVWLGIGIVVAAIMEWMLVIAGQETVPDFMITGYRTAVFLPLFWLALVIAAPVFEETLFRGFLFRGWMTSRLGETGTIFLTAATWSMIHLQYDFVQLFVVFVYGIVLGLARYRTGSLFAPLVVHAAINLAATIQVAMLA